MREHKPETISAVPAQIVAVAFAGALAALAGGYWDDAWHTERGRDDFFIAPHIAIYLGITVTGAALTLWLLLTARRTGPATAVRHPPLALALLSIGVTLASAPVDNAWHEAFGRDAVIWSPPHMLGIAGTFGLGAALLVNLAARPERWTRAAAYGAGALVLSSAAFATIEYDTDVPQFSVAFYLPVLGLASAVALTVVRVALDARWAATIVALAHTGFVACVAALIALLGFEPPALPLLFAVAPVIDVASTRRLPAPIVAALYTVALHLAYVPVRNLLGDGVEFTAGDLAASIPLTFVAVLVVVSLARSPRPSGRVLSAAALAGCLFLLVAAPASAHDPGQGERAGTVGLEVTARSEVVTLAVRPAGACGRVVPVAVVARRAGTAVRAPLIRRGCGARGAVRVPGRGRWFVYAELRRGGERVESWLPITVRPGADVRVADQRRYAYVAAARSNGGVELAAGVLLYAAMGVLLAATLMLVRRQRSAHPA